MSRLLWALLGLAVGYALRRPVCQKVHVEMRHLAPAIVDLADDVQPADSRPAALSAELVAARLDRVTGPPTSRSWPGHVLSFDRPSDCPECEALRQAMLRPPSGP